jgi:lipid II:glycine glycyltransferase (peptidoglycan interpeptide bridge formation enzyme)
MQLSGWAETKRVNGWEAVRLLDTTSDREIGAQVLVQRRPPLPWAYAYAPRGPVTEAWEASTIDAFTALARRRLREDVGRVSHLRIDPEVELGGVEDRDGSLRAALRRAGWRPAPSVQANATRVIDLGTSEDTLWSGMRKKWRQYCSKARTSGVVVVDGGGEDLDRFYAIYRETADRAGFVIRAASAYRDVWDAFSASGAARLLFARAPDGEDLATLFLLRAGGRVIEPFGGMTDRGAELRANYLLKWEAIRSSNEAGAEVYDLWGLPNRGIAYFKEGFGGREVRYIGAWDLVLDPIGWLLYAPVRRAIRRSVIAARRLARGRGAGSTGEGPGAGADPAGGADA